MPPDHGALGLRPGYGGVCKGRVAPRRRAGVRMKRPCGKGMMNEDQALRDDGIHRQEAAAFQRPRKLKRAVVERRQVTEVLTASVISPKRRRFVHSVIHHLIALVAAAERGPLKRAARPDPLRTLRQQLLHHRVEWSSLPHPAQHWVGRRDGGPLAPTPCPLGVTRQCRHHRQTRHDRAFRRPHVRMIAQQSLVDRLRRCEYPRFD